jgi:hypothetical protein
VNESYPRAATRPGRRIASFTVRVVFDSALTRSAVIPKQERLECRHTPSSMERVTLVREIFGSKGGKINWVRQRSRSVVMKLNAIPHINSTTAML